MDRLLQQAILEARKGPSQFSSERFSILVDRLVRSRMRAREYDNDSQGEEVKQMNKLSKGEWNVHRIGGVKVYCERGLHMTRGRAEKIEGAIRHLSEIQPLHLIVLNKDNKGRGLFNIVFRFRIEGYKPLHERGGGNE